MQACCKLSSLTAPILRLIREMFCTEQRPSDEPRLQATVVEQGAAEVEEGLRFELTAFLQRPKGGMIQV